MPDQPVAEVDQALVDRVSARVAETGPLVHCLTNIVVAGFTANVLLAAGAAPAMVENPEEAGELATVAGGVLVNLGTMTAGRADAMRAASHAAHEAGRPWVLDPVAAGALSYRTALAVQLLGAEPAVIRGNASEILSLAAVRAGRAPEPGKGVDSLAGAEQAKSAAQELADSCRAVVAVSGQVDYVTDGRREQFVSGGHPLMARVTGIGCALGALMAAHAAVADDPFEAAVAASAVFAGAGAVAAAGPDGPVGPGTFAVRFLDEIGRRAPVFP